MTRLVNARYVVIALATVFGLALTILMALQIDSAREEALSTGSRAARNLASTLAQHTRQSLGAVDLVLQGLGVPEVVTVLLDPHRKAQSYSVLRNRARSVQGVYSIIVANADGKVVSTSYEQDASPRDLSNAPAFVAARDGRESAISPPVVADYGPAADKGVMIITRRLEARDGSFLGMVEATLAVDHFTDFYHSLDIGPRGVIAMLRHDGVVLIRYPDKAKFDRIDPEKSTIIQALRKGAEQGEATGVYATDGIRRRTAYRDVPELAAYVTVGLAMDDVLAGWRRTALAEAASAAAVMLVLSILTVLANRLLTVREHERERFAARLNRLATASTEIASIHTGAGLVAGLRRIVQELVPGGHAEVRFALGRTGAGGEVVVEPQRVLVPLQAKGGRVLGTLEVIRTEGPALSSQDAAVMSQLALIGTVALENVELLAESNRLAVQAERARGEEAEARQRIEDVFATMSEGVYTLDHAWRFTFLNDNAVKLITRRRDELLGRVIWEALDGIAGSDIQNRFERAVAEQRPAEFEFEFDTGSGSRWSDIRAFPTKDGLTVYLRDITQRMETEGKLRQAQKMEAIGQLTGGIAHDFNNLLTVVLGNVDILVDALAPNAKLKRVAEVARDAAMRGATLVARLLAFARRQTLAPRPVDINALTRNVEDLLRRTIGETVRVEIKRGDRLWRANIDPVQMENALLNLALNARDAMPGGGLLTIETSNAQLDSGYIDETQIVPGDYVMVSVSDTGTGMTVEVKSRAFDPFFTTKPVGQGSGLGLSMVYGFVHQSGGYVRIDSEVEHGTTVRMFLPRASDIGQVDAPARGDRMVLPAGHETILLVEDDELVREHLTETLKSLGYAIIPCGTGREAVDLVQGGVSFDVLLTDVMLVGGMNGQGVAERIKHLRPEMPVLFMSGYTEEAIVHGGKLDAGIHFISKPFRRQDIAAKLREVLSGAAAPVH